MSQESPSSSALSSAPDSPHLSSKGATSNSSAPPLIPATEQPNVAVEGGDLAVSLETTSPGMSPASALRTTDERAIQRSPKRARAENGNDDDPSVPKKLRRDTKSEVEVPNEPAVNDTNHAIADDGASSAKQENQATAALADRTKDDLNAEELAEPEEPVTRSEVKSTNPISNKMSVALGRHRACDTCKRRKVKCKHNLAQKEIEEDHPKQPDLKVVTAKAKKVTNPTQAETGGGSSTIEASTAIQNVGQVDDVEDRDVPIEEEPPKKSKGRGRAAPKKATAPPERISARNRKAPERFETLGKVSLAKKGTSKVFDPIYITTNSTSRLGKADMYHMLLEDTAWTSLSAEQQATLVSMLPDTAETQQLLSKIKGGETEDTRPQSFMVSNVCFRTDVAKFQEDLTNGHLAKTWQAAAEQAVVERAAGEYDAWKAEEAELWWGQKSK